MSEASRMERAIAGVEGEDFDLAAVLRGCVEAYGALAAPRRVDGDIPAAPVIMHGAPELVAQALDKLFDNARSFTRTTAGSACRCAPARMAPKSASPTAARCCRRPCR